MPNSFDFWPIDDVLASPTQVSYSPVAVTTTSGATGTDAQVSEESQRDRPQQAVASMASFNTLMSPIIAPPPRVPLKRTKVKARAQEPDTASYAKWIKGIEAKGSPPTFG